MSNRLNDLLDRLRPTGAPGAAASPGSQVDDRTAELADVMAVLQSFEAATSAETTADVQVSEIRDAMQRQVRSIDDGLPDRLASAGASDEFAWAAPGGSSARTRIEAEALAELERIEHHAADLIRRVSTQAVQLLRAEFMAEHDGA